MKIQTTEAFEKWRLKIKDKKLFLAVHNKIRQIEDNDYFGKTYPITNGISEIKIEMGKGYRIYFNVYIKNEKVIFLNAGDKSTQNKDIEIAKELLREIEKQKKARI